ncbi:MAG: hypothetical protein QNK37_13140 [Acidobacteriota bacterium]|nr:hypothetical protein [Acidobacteriota bacterium]
MTALLKVALLYSSFTQPVSFEHFARIRSKPRVRTLLALTQYLHVLRRAYDAHGKGVSDGKEQAQGEDYQEVDSVD